MVIKKRRTFWQLIVAFVRWLGLIAVVGAVELLIGIILLLGG